MSKDNIIANRKILLGELEKYLNKNDETITVYFSKDKDYKVEAKINNKILEAQPSKELEEQFEKVPFTKVCESITHPDEKEKARRLNSFKNRYNDINEGIKSNKLISVNHLMIGLFGPLESPEREAQTYNVYSSVYFKVDDLKKIDIDIDFKGKLKDFPDEFITPIKLTNIIYPVNLKDNKVEDSNPKDEEEQDDDQDEPKSISRNMIYFGPPGTGKSYDITFAEKSIQVKDDNITRVTFHPEYSYYDFIGQYKPTVGYELVENQIMDSEGNKLVAKEGNESKFKRPIVYYDFIPGPFTKSIVNALKSKDTNENVLLVIEEINRGNSSAIFGDVFQLLDRVNDPNKKNYGKSQYKIEISNEMKSFIMKELKWSTEDWGKYFPDGFLLPKNLFIFATMNTSDQSLFPIDSAFKRRWSMKYVSINYEIEELENLFLPSPYDDIKWLDFINIINKKIVAFTETDDKQIGQWFVGHELDKDEFKGKVLSYLWFDVFRQQGNIIFDPGIKTFDDIDRLYNTGVFNDEIIKEMKIKND